MAKISQKKLGVILSYISYGVHMLSAFLYTPIMLRLLGQSEYGLYQLVNSVVSYLGLLSFGFSGAYTRFYSRYKKDNDENSIAKLNGLFMIIFSIIALVCILCGLVMMQNIKLIFSTGLTEAEYPKTKILMLLMVLGLATTLFSTVFTCYATVHEKFVFQRSLEILQNLLNPFISLPLLIMGKGSVAMVIVSTSLVFAKFIVNTSFCFKKLHIKFLFKNIDSKLFKEIGIFTSFIFLNQIIDQINWSLDKVLLGRFSGTTAVAIYGVASNLNLMYKNLLSSISSVFVPKINMIVAKAKDVSNQLTDIFTRVGRIQFMMASLILSGFIFFGKQFIKIWAGNGYDDSFSVALLLMIPITVELVQYLGIEIQRAKNMHKARSVIYIVTTVFNVILSIIFIQKLGVKGAAIGTAVSVIVGEWLFINVYYQKKIKLDIIYFWKSIFKLIPSIIPPVICGILIAKFCKISNLLSLVFFILVYAAIFAISVYFVGMNKDEKEMIKPFFKIILKKLKKKH